MYKQPEFNIYDVACLLNLTLLNSGTIVKSSFGVVCPYCGDRRGKMNLCIEKNNKDNVYHCFNCGANGNMYTLYADLIGLTGKERYKEAYKKIKEELGHCYGSTEHKSIAVYEPVREAALADLKVRDETYRALLSVLSLDKRHFENLRERGFTNEQIEEIGFKSTQAEDTEAIARKLLYQGCRLKGVPGFFMNGHNNWDIAFYKYNRGFLCPVPSVEGEIQGFQICLDIPYKGMKYGWLTSAGKNQGVTSKSPVGFFGDPDAEYIEVTEGPLKGSLANKLSGISYLAPAGVNQYRNLREPLTVLKNRRLKYLREAYDMDKFLNPVCCQDYNSECIRCQDKGEVTECPKKITKRDNIRKGCTHLYSICNELKIPCKRRVWDKNEKGFWNGAIKGIDNFWLDKKCLEIKGQEEDSWGYLDILQKSIAA